MLEAIVNFIAVNLWLPWFFIAIAILILFLASRK